ncbi:MAG: hypothetical protein AAFR64_04390 [Pseudomonadota bacterium]
MRFALKTIAPLALIGALGACGSESSGTFSGEDGETGEYTIDRETGETSATIETAEGTATLRSGADVPVDLPAGFDVYPGATVVTNTVVNQGTGSGALVTMSSADSPADIAAYYKAQAVEAGVEIQMEMVTNGGQILGGESADGLTFSMIASPGEEATTVQLTVGNKLD